MFKQLTLAATLLAATTLFAPEAKAMTAAQAVDHQQELSMAAFNRNDIAKFCVHEANLLFIEREAPGTLTNTFKTQTQNNIALCNEKGYSTKATMEVESNTAVEYTADQRDVMCQPQNEQTRYALEILGQAPDCTRDELNAGEAAYQQGLKYCQARGADTVDLQTGKCVWF